MSVRQLYAHLRALWNWRRKESELDEELQFHLSEEADERAAAGITAEQAQLAARRDFGNVVLVRERTREVWGWGSAERLIAGIPGAVERARGQSSGWSVIRPEGAALQGIRCRQQLRTVDTALWERSTDPGQNDPARRGAPHSGWRAPSRLPIPSLLQ